MIFPSLTVWRMRMWASSKTSAVTTFKKDNKQVIPMNTTYYCVSYCETQHERCVLLNVAGKRALHSQCVLLWRWGARRPPGGRWEWLPHCPVAPVGRPRSAAGCLAEVPHAAAASPTLRCKRMFKPGLCFMRGTSDKPCLTTTFTSACHPRGAVGVTHVK